MNIIIMAGGTGGHVFPALAVANALKAKGATIHWLGTKAGMEYTIVKEAGYTFHTLSVAGFRRHRWYWRFISLVKLPLALIQALWIIRRVKPSVVLGMGGYASAPGAMATYLLRIPLVIHEQNAILGATNRFLKHLATSALSAFPGIFPSGRAPAYVTGNPVRQALLAVAPLETLKLGERLRLLIMGGSQGTHFFNTLLPSVIAKLNQAEEGSPIDLWHITGPDDYEATQAAYQAALGEEAMSTLTIKVEPFCNAMEEAYGWATIVLCRSGAMTVSELATVGRPSILVPYPYAVDDHQTANANYLVQAGAAVLIQQTSLTVDWLVDKLLHFYHHPDALNKMSRAALEASHEYATQAVVNHILSLTDVE